MDPFDDAIVLAVGMGKRWEGHAPKGSREVLPLNPDTSEAVEQLIAEDTPSEDGTEEQVDRRWRKKSLDLAQRLGARLEASCTPEELAAAREALKDADVPRPPWGERDAAVLAHSLLGIWVHWSGWGSAAPTWQARFAAVQDVARDAFALADSPHPEPDLLDTKGEATYRILTSPPVRKVVEEALKAQYAATQEFLEDAGIDHVTVYRGVGHPPKTLGAPVPPGGAWMAARSQPLTSWSSTPEWAQNFVDAGGAMLAVSVPRAEVFSLPMTGFGSHQESEVVLLGGNRRVFAYGDKLSLVHPHRDARTLAEASRRYAHSDLAWDEATDRFDLAVGMGKRWEGHTADAHKLSPEVRTGVAKARTWEQTRPWDASDEDLKAGRDGVRYSDDVRGEAENRGGVYLVGPKFLALDPAMRRQVLYHEVGHDLSDAMLKDGSAWAALDTGVLPESLNGHTTPGEILAEAFALLHAEPTFLSPALADAVTLKAREYGFPVPAWVMTREEFQRVHGANAPIESDAFARHHLSQVPKGKPGLAVEGDKIVVRDASGSPVGVTTLVPVKAWGKPTGERELDNTAVAPEARRQGIATQLYEKAAELGVTRSATAENVGSAGAKHKLAVAQAVEAGFPVPSVVRQEYHLAVGMGQRWAGHAKKSEVATPETPGGKLSLADVDRMEMLVRTTGGVPTDGDSWIGPILNRSAASRKALGDRLAEGHRFSARQLWDVLRVVNEEFVRENVEQGMGPDAFRKSDLGHHVAKAITTGWDEGAQGTSALGGAVTEALRLAAQLEFGVTAPNASPFLASDPRTPGTLERLRHYDALLTAAKRPAVMDVLRGFLRDCHEMTQRELSEAGMDFVTVFRGTTGPKMSPELMAQADGSAAARKALQTSLENGVWTHIVPTALSSWTAVATMASHFAEEGQGLVWGVRVPRAQVIALPGTLGVNPGEREVVLLGGTRIPAFVLRRRAAEEGSVFWRSTDASRLFIEKAAKGPSVPISLAVGMGQRWAGHQKAVPAQLVMHPEGDPLYRVFHEDTTPELRQRDKTWLFRAESRMAQEPGYDTLDEALGTPAGYLAKELRDLWGIGAAGTFPRAAVVVDALAEAARAEFGLAAPTSYTRHFAVPTPSPETQQEIDRIADALATPAAQQVLRTFLRTTYEQTQQAMQEAGLTHVTLYRGTKTEKMAPSASPLREPGEWREPEDVGAMTSWTASVGMAREFATYKGVVWAVRVPRERVLAAPGTALVERGGGEVEFVVLGGKLPMFGTRVASVSAEGERRYQAGEGNVRWDQIIVERSNAVRHLSDDVGASVPTGRWQRRGVPGVTDAPASFDLAVGMGKRWAGHMKPVDTSSAAFKQWFGESRVVDKDGKPLVVYHGTDADISQFRPTDEGIFFSTSKVASRYASFADGRGNVIPAYLSLQNPLVVSAPNDGSRMSRLAANYYDIAGRDLQARARAGGHDGIIVREKRGREDISTYVAFHPEQIKSAISNRGTFDPTAPEITLRHDLAVGMGKRWEGHVKDDAVASLVGAPLSSADNQAIRDVAEGWKDGTPDYGGVEARLTAMPEYAEAKAILDVGDIVRSPEMTPSYNVASALRGAWTTGMHSPHNKRAGLVVTALREAAKAEFGLDSPTDLKGKFVAKQVLDETQTRQLEALRRPAVQAVMRRFLREEYQRTQEALAERGITHIMVWRATDTAKMTPGRTEARAVPVDGEWRLAEPGALTSWSVYYNTAREFGDLMWVARVPRERVLAIPGSTLADQSEGEIVVLGGPMPAFVQRTDDVVGAWREQNDKVLGRAASPQARYERGVRVWDVAVERANAKAQAQTHLTADPQDQLDLAVGMGKRWAGHQKGTLVLGEVRVLDEMDQHARSVGPDAKRNMEIVTNKIGRAVEQALPSKAEQLDVLKALHVGRTYDEELSLGAEIANEARLAWKVGHQTTMSSEAASVCGALREAARLEFGLTSPQIRPAGRGDDDKYFARDVEDRTRVLVGNPDVMTALRAVLRATHESTQALLAKRGVTHVTVFRGTHSTAMAATPVAGADHGTWTTIEPGDMTSWTARPDSAGIFAEGSPEHPTGYLWAARFPREQVLSVPTELFGFGEAEVLILGKGTQPAYVEEYARSQPLDVLGRANHAAKLRADEVPAWRFADTSPKLDGTPGDAT